MNEQIQKLVQRLNENDVTAFYVKDREKARDKIMSLIPRGSAVALGDLPILREIGLVEMLERGNYDLLDPWKPEISEEASRFSGKIRSLNVFVTGVDALTLGGRLVNVGQYGRRMAMMLLGSEKIIVVVSADQIVMNLEQADHQVRETAAVWNIKRDSERDPSVSYEVTDECNGHAAALPENNKLIILQGELPSSRGDSVITVVIVGST